MSIVNSLPDKGVVAVVGLQWGDEGKGKFVDLFAQWADVVARGTGGANAGHTIVVNGVSSVFHLVPSAILRDQEGVVNIIGRGVAFDPYVMLSELAELFEAGISFQRLKISTDAHLVLPHHVVRDRLSEASSGLAKIGTTGRGIGPTYSDHVGRCGLKVSALLNADTLRRLLEKNIAVHSATLRGCEDQMREILESDIRFTGLCSKDGLLDTDLVVERYLHYGQELVQHIANTDTLVNTAVKDGMRVLLEGAQATLLSIEHGIYPMVTSSDCTIAGLAQGVGLLQSQVDLVYGVVKAPFMTRVGSGTFPTELSKNVHDEALAEVADINSADVHEQSLAIRRIGNEFGSTTARPRRIGWLDLPLLRYAVQFGVDRLILTKFDVLDTCAEIKICTGYQYTGPTYDFGDSCLMTGDEVSIACGSDDLMSHMVPRYKTFPGWQTSLQEVLHVDDLPAEVLALVDFIKQSIELPVSLLSVGPGREETVIF